jgi:glycosyltransferase involved in cell wall biosynthesis
MQSPVCTIVIPALDCLKKLMVALAPGAMQRAGEIEVIVLEGGSADGTGAWLKERSREWPALRAIETGGCSPARARNAGIEAARAPLIAFLRDLASAEDWDLWLRLAAEAPAAYSKAVTATCLVRPPAASIRRAAAKARASLNLARAALARPAGRFATAAPHRSRAFIVRPLARPGKEIRPVF